jgi:hypothetical protein
MSEAFEKLGYRWGLRVPTKSMNPGHSQTIRTLVLTLHRLDVERPVVPWSELRFFQRK